MSLKAESLHKKNKSIVESCLKLSMFFFLLIIGLCFVQAADEYKPYLHNPSVGDVPKLQTFGEYKTELFPGAATYSYAITFARNLPKVLHHY